MSGKKVIVVCASLLAVTGLVIWTSYRQTQPEVVFLNVGQGDAIYIRLADGFDVLIDGGPDDSLITELGKYQPFYDREIELVILTHAHADHATGLVELLQRYTVDRVLYPGPVDYQSAPYQELLAEIDRQKILLERVVSGETFQLPGDARLDILYPFQSTPLTSPDINELSVVSRLTVSGHTFLFTGDAGVSVEDELLAAGVNVSADVLKVGHHGSRGSSGEAFLAQVLPVFAVISCGEGNTYGHPHQEALNRLRQVGATIFRTDQTGDVRCLIGHTDVTCSSID